ncbi:S-adenosyl-L-methionine-dependent methyltransferase [Lactarius pseudohatsudake]|nr:S-adenosyl-L-methionine-dependent methyltransferase [Lactarius pseudohatsudake]
MAKISSSVKDITALDPPFGARFLTESADVWSQNAWDHVPSPPDQHVTIATSLARQRAAPVPQPDKQKYNAKPAKHWDNFYKTNASNFFKNRKWLHLEFPELVASAELSAGPRTVVEVGCGAGNAIFPLLEQNRNPELRIHAFDYSSHAIKLVQHNTLYTSPPCGTITASVWDLSSASPPPDLAPRSADILVLVFVLSALHPSEWPQAISNIAQMLKPGGLVLMRDYGRYDLTQLRFKAGRLLDDNFYIRGDGTRVYFFELDELALLFTGSSAPTVQVQVHTHESNEADEDNDDNGGGVEDGRDDVPTPGLDSPPPSSDNPLPNAGPSTEPIHPSLRDPAALGLAHPLFITEQLGVDRRLLVNRKRQLKMYRIWMQGKFRRSERDASLTVAAAEPCNDNPPL